ncbi:hypothetical protein BRARA_A01935 [Brassica rapa]|uniref:MPN domain-containing protein n=1 Tax=Brassica campestris TaxID=3711 RepID=A0A398AV01_BRACM|nr:hypothetical protein BRARA_A01935 [Brassica rapa]
MKIDLNKVARKIEVNNHISLASIYREEKNVVDLYIMLLRYSSLISENVPLHQDYQASLSQARLRSRKRLRYVINELESLKPEFDRQVDELNREDDELHRVGSDFPVVSYSSDSTTSQPSSTYNNSLTSSSNRTPIDQQFQKLSSDFLPPNQATLSRHSFLGPNGLKSQWVAPSRIKVQYPNDGRWQRHFEAVTSQFFSDATEDPFQFVGMKQPTPPFAQICPSKVADPRPEPALPSLEEKEGSSAYQHLHVPVRIMEDFLRLARSNTKRNLETCGVLAGSLKNRVFYITTLIIPKQESTSDSEIFEVQDILSLFPLGWIHTHPTETCFMSSVDLHTHYSYQIMLPEAVAIVMARTDETTPHGIFHLSDPSGVFVIRNCQQRGFHPHEKSEDSNPIYEHCSHVFLNAKLKYEVLELR